MIIIYKYIERLQNSLTLTFFNYVRIAKFA